MPFSNLPPVLAEALAARGYAEPTPVQAAVLEARRRRARPDRLGADRLGQDRRLRPRHGARSCSRRRRRCRRRAQPLALVIAPTRELALQVSRELIWLYGKAGARVATCVGGMDPSKERRALRARARTSSSARRGGCATISSAARSTSAGCARSCSTRPTRCSTWASARTSRRSSTPRRPSAARCCSRRRCRKPIVALARRYQSDALRISTVGEDRGHGDIAYQALDRRTGRDRACGGQPAALPRGRDRRCCSAPRATMSAVSTPA